MTTKPAFPALGAPMLPASVHGSPHVEDLALPKSLKSGNFTLEGCYPVDIGWNASESLSRQLPLPKNMP